MILGLFVGESFAELSLVQDLDRSLVHHQRWYLPKHNLRTYLQNWLVQYEKDSGIQPDRVIVASRFPNKLAGHRLGGSVAQIVTQGFEKWIQFSLPEKSKDLQMPQRIPSLSASELIFPIQEKISSTGLIEIPLPTEELDALCEKLKAAEIKKVCIHLLNTDKNPTHHLQIKTHLTGLGFEIFEPQIPTAAVESDLFRLWKTNTLNAAITGTFEEIKSDICEGLASAIPAEKIYFFDADLNFHQGDIAHRLSSLFSLEACLSSQLNKQMSKNKKTPLAPHPLPILHLGLEHFSLISEDQGWAQSRWGQLSIQSQNCFDFKIQPTSLIEIDSHHELKLLQTQSFEPGPIRLGRGLKPLVADLFFREYPVQKLVGLDEKQHQTSLDRWKMILHTWQRSHQLSSISKNEFENSLLEEVGRRLLEDMRPIRNTQMLTYGFFAADFKFKNISAKHIPESAYPKSYLIACEALDRGLL